ncbi:hypothetical protein EAG_05144 [Camponotus floridanus]|uniref:Uncharacterized protein n=1 Tax=Camponotus floridanus TaxID=104421 RepID=E1ZV03_CAMFO|nr:hypothetical protein EAG_05144 [Camponotus floridanus]
MQSVDFLEEASIVALKNLSSTLCVPLPLAHIHPNIALALKAVKVAAAESGEVPRPLSPVKGHCAPSTIPKSIPWFRTSKSTALAFSSA